MPPNSEGSFPSPKYTRCVRHIYHLKSRKKMAISNLYHRALTRIAMGRLPRATHSGWHSRRLNTITTIKLRYQEFHRLPAGFEYSNRISETSNRISFITGLNIRDRQRCVVCGLSGEQNYGHTHRMHVIKLRDKNLISKLASVSCCNLNQPIF